MRRVTHFGGSEQEVPVDGLGEELVTLRLPDPTAERVLRRSLAGRGQLTPLVAHRPGAGGRAEIIDGFKRLHAARALEWATLRVRVLDVDRAQAKAMLRLLNERRALTELEEGWLIRSLYLDDGLTQPAIGHMLGRHKSWVCRRLALATELDPAVEAQARLGLVRPRAAAAIARLPRGNQMATAEVVTQRGLTTRQAEELVRKALELPSGETREALLTRAAKGEPTTKPNGRSSSPKPSPQWIQVDIERLTRSSARLQARLLQRPMPALGEDDAKAVRCGLEHLRPVLVALDRTIGQILANTKEQHSHAEMVQP